MPNHDDILIIGGGVIGVCVAYYLAERGGRVTLIERGEIAAGSSYGNAGLIVPSHSVPLAAPGALADGLRWMLDPESPFYIKPRFDRELIAWLLQFSAACTDNRMRQSIPVLRDLGRASRALYDELAALGFDFGYETKGLLCLYVSQSGLAEGEEEARLLQQYGLTTRVLDAAQVRQHEPNVQPEVIGGVYFPNDAHLNPARFVRGLAQQAEQRGAKIKTGVGVVGFEIDDRRVTKVKTTRGDFEAGQVVLAAGSWSPVVARDLRLNIPIQPAKGYSITVKRPAAGPSVPLLLEEAHVGVTPLGDQLRFAGTLELAGLDFTVNQRRVNAIRRGVQRYLPGMERLEEIEVWRGLRPCTPDGLPIIGRVSLYDNLILATGHAMVGMSLGPITGKLVSQIVCREQPEIDLRPLRAERFL